MDHTVVCTAEYDDPQRARRVAASLAPEAGAVAGDRTSVECAREGSTVTVTVSATDLVALRAGTNSWTRLLSVAESLS